MDHSSTSHTFKELKKVEHLFDGLEDLVYFIKDKEGRYISVNDTLVERLGAKSKEEILGKAALQVFPDSLGREFSLQDLNVIETGVGIREKLELHLYEDGSQGWALTNKEPILNDAKEVIGISGVSRDVLNDRKEELFQLEKVLSHIELNIDQPLPLKLLSEIAEMSSYQLERMTQKIFGVTMGQYVTKIRIEEACKNLRSTDNSIVEVAFSSGYSDQSAFTRQFKKTTGITPKRYRELQAES